MNRCEYCGEKYYRRQHNQRFCGSLCAGAWHQDERRRAIELLRRQTGPLPEAIGTRDTVPAEPPIGGNLVTYREKM